jgi:hypothetical protein
MKSLKTVPGSGVYLEIYKIYQETEGFICKFHKSGIGFNSGYDLFGFFGSLKKI